ncbi:MAG: MFS transporter [Clostridiales bacterium]|nr:MFS transporter [Clostridiales bacterium]
MPGARQLDAHYIAVQAGFWSMFGSICGYLTALLQGRGFSNSQIGLLIAIRCLAGIFLQPLLGGWADRHPRVPLKVVVDLSLALSLVTGILFAALPGMGFFPTAVVFIILGGFEISAYPLVDAMAFQFIHAGAEIRYSLGRGIGSLSYAVTCVLLGLLSSRRGTESVLIVHAALVALEMVLVWSFPTFPADRIPPAQTAEKPHSTLQILRANPHFALMLAAILFALTGIMPLSNFLINILRDKGGGSSQLGLGLFLMAASELPGSQVFARLHRRGMGSDRLLLLSMVFMFLRTLAFLLVPSAALVLAFEPLQMLGYGVFTPAAVFYVSDSVPPADQVKGQTLMMAASNGLGGVLSSLMAGRMLDLGQAAGAGSSWMLLACLGCGAVGLILARLALQKK